VSGIAWRVQIMALKFISGTTGRGATSDAIECIEYAIANGADHQRKLRRSFHRTNAVRSGGIRCRPPRARCRNHFRRRGRQRWRGHGPLGALPRELSPRERDRRGQLDDARRHPIGTNYGSGSVELFAPGTEIYSLSIDANSPYISRSGTSMAAPHVVGALALLKAQFPNDTYRQLINRILRNVDPVPSFAGKVQTGGRLNLDRAIRSTDNRPFNDDFATRAHVSGSNLAIRAVEHRRHDRSRARDRRRCRHRFALVGVDRDGQWRGARFDRRQLLRYGAGSVHRFVAECADAVASNDNASDRVTSRLEFAAQAGTAYQIVVAGKAGGNGLTLLDVGAVPVHDNFANAQTITGRSVA
jgi:hypothetical protein